MLATLRVASFTFGTSAALAASLACGALAVTALADHHRAWQPVGILSTTTVTDADADPAAVPADFVWPSDGSGGHDHGRPHTDRPSHALRVSPADFVWP
ncbi:hypothetical protein [Actinacidiphila sp. ITFR-21]|uniref:hypothetical protein n=1 Tax=Actinacidiphila sp. ITFR-21 TaxID=3075199 RepID=UPI00288BC5E0|nr:hypothetical protein [Streptomyces sp. ITFR-21]WNI17348.1 hypothetical protein RLT57_18705 [Streptomyces sp. ITFR-21]